MPRKKIQHFKASQLLPGCLQFPSDRRAICATIFQTRERLRSASAPPSHTVFKFVAIMRQSAANGKHNAAVCRMGSALSARTTPRLHRPHPQTARGYWRALAHGDNGC